MLREGRENHGFVYSVIDECVFYSEGAVIITYVDDCIIFGDNPKLVDDANQSLWEGPKNFNLTDEGDMDKYLGIEVRDLGNDIFELA